MAESSTSKPIPAGHFTSDVVPQLLDKLSSVSNLWFELGKALGLPEYFLEGLYPSKPRQDRFRCFTSTLSYWLRNPNLPEQPNTVALLLEAVDVIDHELAKNLQTEFTNHDIEVSTDDLSMLSEKLFPLVSRWRMLGRRLGVPEYELESIESSKDNVENMCQMLNEWVRRKADQATFICLCNALASRSVSEGRFSFKIREDKDILKLLTKEDGMENGKVKSKEVVDLTD